MNAPSPKNFANLLWYYWRRNNWIFHVRRFTDNYKDIEINRAIFLVGNQGDGLTLVARTLRRHPRVVSITGNHKYWAGADEMQNVMRCRLPVTLRQGGRFICRDYPHPKFTPPRSWSYGSDDLIRYYRKTAADYDEKTAEILAYIIEEALYRFGNNETRKRFIDKSQVFSVKMSYVDALLKATDPQFVLITRNPYATCYRAALGAAGDMRRYSKYMSLDERIEVCVQHWSNIMHCILEDKDKVSNFKWIRFEDILQEPRKSLMDVCDFLHLEFVEDMIPKGGDTIPFGSRYRNRWYPLRPKVNAPYLKQIPSEYVSMIRERCGRIAEQFGYFPPKRVGDRKSNNSSKTTKPVLNWATERPFNVNHGLKKDKSTGNP